MFEAHTIVLVEDNAADVFLVRTALEQEKDFKFELQVFGDGEEALRYLSQPQEKVTHPDLFILDLNLPKRSGLDILEALRSRPDDLFAPVIVISSSDSPSDRASAAMLGAARFFPKPADLDEFMKIGGIVRDVLRKQAA